MGTHGQSATGSSGWGVQGSPLGSGAGRAYWNAYRPSLAGGAYSADDAEEGGERRVFELEGSTPAPALQRQEQGQEHQPQSQTDPTDPGPSIAPDAQQPEDQRGTAPTAPTSRRRRNPEELAEWRRDMEAAERNAEGMREGEETWRDSEEMRLYAWSLDQVEEEGERGVAEGEMF